MPLDSTRREEVERSTRPTQRGVEVLPGASRREEVAVPVTLVVVRLTRESGQRRSKGRLLPARDTDEA
jgi:hypothetical protein